MPNDPRLSWDDLINRIGRNRDTLAGYRDPGAGSFKGTPTIAGDPNTTRADLLAKIAAQGARIADYRAPASPPAGVPPGPAGPVYATYSGGAPTVFGQYTGGGPGAPFPTSPAPPQPAPGPPMGGGGIPPSMIPGLDGRLPSGQWPPTPGPGGHWPPGMPNVASPFSPAQQAQLTRAMGAQGVSPWIQGLLGQFGGMPAPPPGPARRPPGR